MGRRQPSLPGLIVWWLGIAIVARPLVEVVERHVKRSLVEEDENGGRGTREAERAPAR